MANTKETAQEDLAIQDTLSMTVEERLDLLASLIVEEINLDQDSNEPIYIKIKEKYGA